MRYSPLQILLWIVVAIIVIWFLFWLLPGLGR